MTQDNNNDVAAQAQAAQQQKAIAFRQNVERRAGATVTSLDETNAELQVERQQRLGIESRCRQLVAENTQLKAQIATLQAAPPAAPPPGKKK